MAHLKEPDGPDVNLNSIVRDKDSGGRNGGKYELVKGGCK